MVYDDFYAQRYDELFYETDLGSARSSFELAVIRAWLGTGAGAERPALLDLGCGTGRHCAALSKELETTGVDVSRSMLERARIASPSTSFVEGDMRDGSLLPKGRFSFVLCLYGAIHYTFDLPGVLANVAAWLAPDGMACIGILDVERLTAEVSGASRAAGDEVATAFPGFLYRSRWERADGHRVYYHETFVLPWLDVVTRRHELDVPPVNAFLDLAEAAGFEVSGRVSLAPVDCDDELLVFLRRRGRGQSK